MVTISADKADRICTQILQAVGVPSYDASILTQNVLCAEMRGVTSHGLTRFTAYVDRIQHNLVSLNPKIKFSYDSPASIKVDGDNGLGQVVACQVIDKAIEKAKASGSCVALTYNTNYIGMLSYYTLRIAEQKMIGVMLCNTPPFVAPTGGMDAVIGTNPICFAVPTGRDFQIVLDMAISPARGKIRLALEQGKDIPPGWAIDSNGNPTTDAKAAMEGTILPTGGPKGYGLGLIVDILSGVLTGASFGKSVPDSLYDLTTTPNLGNFIMVIDIEKFMPIDFFNDRLESVISNIKASKKLDQVSEIHIPGEIEHQNEMRCLREGIAVDPKIWGKIEELGKKLNIDVN